MKILKTIISDRNLLYLLCGLAFAILLIISLVTPNYLLNNAFLMNFIKNEFLNVLAVTTSVTLAVSAHLVTLVSSLEDTIDELEFPRLRRSLARNMALLGGYFISSILLLIIESSITKNLELRAAIVSLLLLFLLMNVISMIQIHMISFKLPTRKTIKRLMGDDNS